MFHQHHENQQIHHHPQQHQQHQQQQQQPLPQHPVQQHQHQQQQHQQQHHHHHHQQQQHQQHQNPKNNGYTMNANGGGSTASVAASSASHLDHALLESLFYNEMVMLEDSVEGHGLSTLSESPLCPPTEHDTPYTILEKEILRDFGVGGGPTLLPPTGTTPAATVPPPPLGAAAATVAPTPYGNNNHSPLQRRNPHRTSEYSTTAMLPPTVSPQDHQRQPMQQQQQQQQQQQHHTNPLPPHQNNLHQHPDTSTKPQYASSTVGTAYMDVVSSSSSSTTTIGSGMVAGQQQQQQQQQQQSPLGGMVCADPQATAMAAAAAAAMLPHSGNNNNNRKRGSGIELEPTTGVVSMMAPTNTSLTTTESLVATATVATMPASNPSGLVAPVPPQTKPNHGLSLSATASPPPPPPPVQMQVQVPQDRARQLVDQFATLASRLGIDLPDSVLQSLTSAAAKNDPTLLLNPQQEQQQQQQQQQQPQQQQHHEQQQTNGATVVNTTRTAGAANGTSTAASNPATTSYKSIAAAAAVAAAAAAAAATIPDGNSSSSTELPTMAPTVMELRKTAEDAIAAVTQSNKDQTMSTTEKPAGAGVNAINGTGSGLGTESKPTYSKRRKKPRLSDCEAKLARLKSENEQLKRHLQNVSNKAHKFDMEKEKASKQIAQLMHDPNAGPREMEIAVRKFSDMYSDYGINRQQELSFHLEQLQRLVNPTNFTKMGLWTLGHSNQGAKKNPIAGILVKELDITPQQSRKILDQSEKIRQLCENLKEAHSLLVKLKFLCEKKTRTFQDRMNKCTEILTSKQVVKLIIWINGHTQLLDSVCPGWGTEHIHSKK